MKVDEHFEKHIYNTFLNTLMKKSLNLQSEGNDIII